MESYVAERTRLIANAKPGIEAARTLSELTDEAVRGLAQAASSHPKGRWALVALGGWGAGALLPDSDLDILVLADARGEEHKPFVEAILYPLWDAGLKVGHQARTPKEQARAMREDSATMTAALTGRPIAGDVEWAVDVLSKAARAVAKRLDRPLKMLRERERPGSPFRLEVNLKEDCGGRRDFDELVWTAAIVSGSTARRPDGLAQAGYLSDRELSQLSAAELTVAEARWILQREGFGDRMTLDAADALPDAEAVQRALALTQLTLDRVRRRVRGTPDLVTDQTAPEQVFSLLETGTNSLPVLEEAALAGFLEELLPGYSDLMINRRPGLGHEFTVGAHSLTAAALISDIGRGDDALRRSRASLGDRRPLLVAALAHDVGKREFGPGHPQRGAPYARQAALRFGLTEAQARESADLVRLHLVLAEAALHSDIDDEDSILHAAATVGRRELVAPLHILTAADSMATGPSTWTDWTEALLAAVASRLDAALSDSVDGAGLATRGETVREATLGALPSDAEEIRDLIVRAPLRYLASREPAEVAKHAKLLASLTTASVADQVAVSVGVGPAAGTHEVTVAAHDRPELFARIAGALALAGLDILASDAYEFGHDLVLDSFAVASATLRPVDTATWQTFERYLRAAMRDRLELETRLDERRRHYPSSTQGPVTVETDASPGYHTIVRVTSPDRPGLLYDLARAVTASGLDIRWAKAVTVEGMAMDSFHVTGPDGSAVTDPGTLGHLAMRMRETA